MPNASQEEKNIIDEGQNVAKQFLAGNLSHVSIDITILQNILDDEYFRDLFVHSFNYEIQESKNT